MRLTAFLMKRKMPNGNIWRGKNRFGHYVYAENIQRFVKRLQLEEMNMYYLRHPYLTLEQEAGHANALNKHEKFLNDKKLYKASKKVLGSTRTEDEFKHLNVTNAWE